jgi:antiviral helicase SKI2
MNSKINIKIMIFSSVLMKGRVACEMGNQNELMVTEMVLNNVFSTSPPEEVAAILSCLVFEAKNVEEPSLVDAPELKRVNSDT